MIALYFSAEMHLCSVYLMCLASAFTVAHGEKANIWTQKMTALLPRYDRDNYQSLLLLPRGPPSGRSKPLPARSHSSGSTSSKSYSPSNGLTTSSSSEGRWDPDQHDPNGDSVSAKVKAHGPAKVSHGTQRSMNLYSSILRPLYSL